ncbi:RimJ/RimL family protein N-acetyltransferase [Virgibacillus profundi]|uniref:RimJ/RimL family protein N-acetyltransferase n=1 Tax=Virgibacillus profundi TaxID=2024555 RepID=A0A2A2IAV1_9BACI|nr:GNAT family protein [Virgibacillus profundi]PAV28446.1 RimJ/RimL family protein N-acetyltransferase [Virgibacillus profundi]PXY52619.1 N-acetyltransferase [Virgibacillus profundi]
MFSREIDEVLELRQLHISDAEELFQITDGSREYLREWLPWVDTTTTVEDSRGFIEHSQRSFEAKKGITCGVFYKRKLVGTAGFNSFDWANKIGYIGYWLSEDYQGLGIMTKVSAALTDYAFSELSLNKVDIRAAYENKKSRAIPERLGFTEEGKIRQAEWLYDHYVDHIVYGMLVREWITH